jgi:lipopolysaccharide assembly outer membrane protein LptD (OstA)
MERKKKLRLAQIFLLIIGSVIIFITYFNVNKIPEKKIISKNTQQKIKKTLSNLPEDGDIFYNIEYSGLDLAGNRYILKSKEAVNSKTDLEIVNMVYVEAVFYFKDSTTLNIESNKGIYNNKTLDMIFKGDAKAYYEGSELLGEIIEYSNSKRFISVSNNVKINDFRGTVEADKLLFDLVTQKLDITAFNDTKVNANINLK